MDNIRGVFIISEQVFHSTSIKKYTSWGWKAGSAVKSTNFSSRGEGFDSQHPYGGSQISLTPVPEI